MNNAPDIANYFFTQGVLGVVVLVLTIAFVYYYRTNEKEKKELNKIIFEQQNQRLQDSKDATKEVTAVLQENSQSFRILSAKIETGKGN